MTKKVRKVNGQRAVNPTMQSDKQSSNLLANKSHNYANSVDNPQGTGAKNRVYKPKKGQTQHQIMLRNAKHNKKRRVYSEKELKIPKLNKSIDPEGIQRGKNGVKGGKKGKVFAQDDDVIRRIANQVDEAQNSLNASKLERSRQLEEIREHKRREIEQKDQERAEKLQQKKTQLKKNKRSKKGGKEDDEMEDDKPKKKKVAFA